MYPSITNDYVSQKSDFEKNIEKNNIFLVITLHAALIWLWYHDAIGAKIKVSKKLWTLQQHNRLKINSNTTKKKRCTQIKAFYNVFRYRFDYKRSKLIPQSSLIRRFKNVIVRWIQGKLFECANENAALTYPFQVKYWNQKQYFLTVNN
jgi:hypothetical protein